MNVQMIKYQRQQIEKVTSATWMKHTTDRILSTTDRKCQMYNWLNDRNNWSNDDRMIEKVTPTTDWIKHSTDRIKYSTDRISNTTDRKSHMYNRLNRAIFVWPWNDYAQTEREQQTNKKIAIWLV